MNLNKQEKQYKEWIGIIEEINRIREELRKLPLIELKEPYQNGWVLSFELRDDIKNRKDYNNIQKALDLVHYSIKTRNVKLIKYIRNHKNFSNFNFNGKKYETIHPQLQLLREKQYNSLTEEIKKWFTLDSENEKYASFRGHKYKINIPRYWLEIRIKPFMITHAYQKGGKLEKRLQFLEDKWNSFHQFFTNYGRTFPANKERLIVKRKINKFLKGEIEDVDNEKIGMEYYY